VPYVKNRGVENSCAAYALALSKKAVPYCITKSDKFAIQSLYIKAFAIGNCNMSVDHIYPISGQRYGVSGLHVIANLKIMPLVENQSKGNRPHQSWIDYSNPDWTDEDLKKCLSLHSGYVE
jgi:hypothetical protein